MENYLTFEGFESTVKYWLEVFRLENLFEIKTTNEMIVEYLRILILSHSDSRKFGCARCQFFLPHSLTLLLHKVSLGE